MSGWATRKLLETNLEIDSDESPLDPKDGGRGLLMGYTTDDGRPIYVDYGNLQRHVLIVGQSGVGKTVGASLMMLQHIANGGGLLFIDGKIDADNVEQLYQFCAWAGRERDFLVINPDDPANSNTYNPILYGDADEVASRILSLIPSTESSPGADHYKQEANQGLSTLIMALKRAGLSYHMMDLSVLLMNANALEDLEKKLLNSGAAGSVEAKNYSLFLDKFRQPAIKPNDPNAGKIDVKKLKDTFGGIGGRMFMFGTGNFGQVMNTYNPEFKVYDIIRNNQIAYVALPTMGKDIAAENFGKMVIGDLRTAVSWLQKLPKSERPNPPFMCFCDEAGSYVGKSWPRLFEQARSAGIFMMPAVQTLANFQSVSEELSEMVKGNTWTKIYFKVGTQATAEEAANDIGMKIGVARALSGSIGESASSQMLRASPQSTGGENEGISETEREEETYRVSPDDLKSLGMGETIMTYGGDKLFNLKIPMIGLTDEMKKIIGPVKINRPINTQKITGANFFEDANKFLAKGKKKAKGKDGEDGADESEE